MKTKRKIVILAAVFCLLFVSFSLVLADTTATSNYPEIAGITINKDTTAAQYIIYFFNLLVAIGSFIAVVIVVMAGIEFLTSAGNPGKLAEAKGKLKNVILGIVVLLGSYLILDAINPSLNNIKINSLVCNQGIQVLTADNQTVCITGSGNISYDIKSTLKWFVGTDTLYKVYIYTGTDYSGTPTEVKIGSGDVSGAKSIYFISKKAGFYLYNGTQYTVGNKPYPVYVSGTIDDLSNIPFDNMTKSMDIINPSDAVSYHAIAFTDPKERGKCSFVGQPVKDMATASGIYYGHPYPIGNDALSSLVVFKEDINDKSYRGSVYLYKVPNCGGTTTGINVNSRTYNTLADLLSDQNASNCLSGAPGATWNGSACICPSGFSNPQKSNGSGGTYTDTTICVQNNSSAAAASGLTTTTTTPTTTTTGTSGSSNSSNQAATTGTDGTVTDSKELKYCKLDVGTKDPSDLSGHYVTPTPHNIYDATNTDGTSSCGWSSGDKVQSFKITGSVGLVLIAEDSGGKCQYWDINSLGDGTCFSPVYGEDVYPALWSAGPTQYMVFPIDKK